MTTIATVLDIYQKPALQLAATAVELTKEEAYKNEIALSYAALYAPLFSNLLYSAMKVVFTEHVDVAATDELSIFINPKRFLVEFDAEEQAFVYAHEIMHRIRRDCSMSHRYREHHGGVVKTVDGDLPFDDQLANIAQDYIINAELVTGKVGKMPKSALYDPKISDGTEDFTVVYARLYKQAKRAGGKPGSKPGKGLPGRSKPGPGQFDEHLPPGVASGKEAGERAADADEQFQMDLASAAQTAKAMGKLPANFLKLINKALANEVAWEDLMRETLMRRTSSGAYDWRSPNRRLIAREERIYAPRRTGFDAGHIVIIVDTSGSVITMVDYFMAHMVTIMDAVNPERVSIVWCDAKVQRIDDDIEDHDDLNTVRHKGAPGGGGTNMNPAIQEIVDRNWTPDAVVCFTDLLIGKVEGVPPWHFIFASTLDCPVPFGDFVMIKPREAR